MNTLASSEHVEGQSGALARPTKQLQPYLYAHDSCTLPRLPSGGVTSILRLEERANKLIRSLLP